MTDFQDQYVTIKIRLNPDFYSFSQYGCHFAINLVSENNFKDLKC